MYISHYQSTVNELIYFHTRVVWITPRVGAVRRLRRDLLFYNTWKRRVERQLRR